MMSLRTGPNARTRNGIGATLIRCLWIAIGTAALSGLAFRVYAVDDDQSKTAQGLTVYIGSMPAEILKGYPHKHPEASTHGGPPGGAHDYHIFAAVFDSATGSRITNATVMAQVEGPALAGPRKPLKPMTMGDALVYGNDFDLPDNSPYTIRLRINRVGVTVRVDFDYGRP